MHDLRYTQSNFKSQYLGLPSYQWIQLTNRNHCPRVPLHETQLLKYPKIITGRRLPYVKLNLNQVLLLQCLVWSGFLLLLQKIRVPRFSFLSFFGSDFRRQKWPKLKCQKEVGKCRMVIFFIKVDNALQEADLLWKAVNQIHKVTWT